MAAHMGKSMANKKRKLAEMSVDEFMSGGIDLDDSDTSPEEENNTQKGKAKGGGKHKKSLEKLKQQDPEFYEFLQKEDQNLLDFQDDDDEYEESDVEDEDDDDSEGDIDDDDDEGSDERSQTVQHKAVKTKNNKKEESSELDFLEELSGSSDEDDGDSGGKFHKLPQQLEVASDESEEDDTEDESDEEEKPKKKSKTSGVLVTLKMVKEWNQSLQNKPNIATFQEVVSAFKAAVQWASSSGEAIKYQVKDSSVFNAVVRLCLANVSSTLHQLLGLPPLTDLSKPTVPSDKNKKWKKVRLDMKAYLTDLLKLIGEMSEPSVLDVILKHVHKLVAFCSCFPKLAKVLMKKMITLWSTAEETTRVLAFFCVNRLVRITQDQLLEPCIKQMYIAYVKNCKFTSPTTLPMINFMQRTLVEIFAIDYVLAYQYTFVYIRQLAIHLRNAITVKKKENCQAVYNWQFIHCLELWVKLLSTTYPNEALEPLIYPLTQTIIGTVKLLPTARYFPLRFHCVKALNMLSEATDTFIPVLPFLLEVFELTNFNKRHANISFKPFNFACILKLSKAQLQEKSFRDGVIDQLYELLLDHFHVHAYSVGFPELVLPAILQLKDFLKKCKVANYCKQIKQILDKVEENSKFITNRRKTLSASLSDTKAIAAWETQCREDGTPLGKYYKTWRKLRDRELQHQIAAKEQIVDDNLPTVVRPKGPAKATTAEKEEFSALFETSSEDEDDENRFLLKSERPAKKLKKTREDSGSEDYSDFDSDELEILAGSGNDDDDDDDEDDNDDDDDDSSDNEDNNEDDNSSDDEMKENADEDQEDDTPDKDDIVEDFEMSDSD